MSKNSSVLKKVRKIFGFTRFILLTTLNPRKIWVAYHPIFYKILHPTQEAKNQRKLLPYFKNKKGIRIGGALRGEFKNYLKNASKVINVDAVPFFFGKPTNADYLTDATDLYFAKDDEFDFLCSSHVLEHLANPIKALKEWMRVIKKEGIIYCGVPDKRFTFDHKRQRTTLCHLIDDYRRNIGSHDITHIYDVLFNSDLKYDSVNREQAFNRILQYYMSGRSPTSQPHHHVYTKEDLIALFKYVGLEIIFVSLIGETIHLVAKKSEL